MIMDEQITKTNEPLPTSIEDLGDELLNEIFIRLPSHESVITSKFVSKRWLFVLRNPKFVVEFLNHKKIQIESKKGQLPWSFLCTMNMKMTSNEDEDGGKNEIPSHKVFNSPKFTLNFLPFPFQVSATFKDLILCRNTGNSNNDNLLYVICNPVTKQWLALPPTPNLSAPIDQRGSLSWARLICEEPHYNVNVGRPDYRFRIVVIHPLPAGRHLVNHPWKVLKMMVFCSESFRWKRINVSVAMRPGLAKHCPGVLRAHFLGMLCNGMVCVRHHPYFGMFNPFDVTPDTLNETTLESRMLPIYSDGFGRVFEYGGRKLVFVTDTYFSSTPVPGPLRFTVRCSELDLKNIHAVPRLWHSNFRGYCTDKGGAMRQPNFKPEVIGMHPSIKHLLYVLTTNKEVVLCDMGSKSLKVLGTLDPDRFESNARLELQSWPTPLPLPPLNHQ